MAQSSSTQDIEKSFNNHAAVDTNNKNVLTIKDHVHRSYSAPFAGRLGGNQAFILDRDRPSNAETLQNVPDAAPGMTFAEQFDLRPFRSIGLWKAAAVEGMG